MTSGAVVVGSHIHAHGVVNDGRFAGFGVRGGAHSPTQEFAVSRLPPVVCVGWRRRRYLQDKAWDKDYNGVMDHIERAQITVATC